MSEAPAFDSHQFPKHLMDNGFTEGLRLAGRGEKHHEAVRASLRAIESNAVGAFDIAGGASVRTGELFRAVQPACGTNLTAAAGPARPGDLKENWLDVSRAERRLGWHIDGFHYDIGTKRDLKLVRNKVETGEIIP